MANDAYFVKAMRTEFYYGKEGRASNIKFNSICIVALLSFGVVAVVGANEINLMG